MSLMLCPSRTVRCLHSTILRAQWARNPPIRRVLYNGMHERSTFGLNFRSSIKGLGRVIYGPFSSVCHRRNRTASTAGWIKAPGVQNADPYRNYSLICGWAPISNGKILAFSSLAPSRTHVRPPSSTSSCSSLFGHRLFSSSSLNSARRDTETAAKPSQSSTTIPASQSKSSSGSGSGSFDWRVLLSPSGWKSVAKKYGIVAIVFHSSVYVTSLSLCYIAVVEGIDLTKVAKFLPAVEPDAVDTLAGRFAVAWAICAATGPARGALTIVASPWIYRYMKRYTWFQRFTRK